MNYRLIFNQLGLLAVVMGAFLIMVGAWSGFNLVMGAEEERAASRALGLTGLVCIALGLGAYRWTKRRESESRRGGESLDRRSAMLLVAMSWLGGAAVAALPYFIWARWGASEEADPAFRSFVNCFFESTSGLTTVGASILSDVESIPRGLLLWRAGTQWLGGIGIVVLFVAVLPMLGGGSNRRMFGFESSGFDRRGAMPQIRDTARVLLTIYTGLTLVQILALRAAGMRWFDAVCHTFTTVATGGFSTRNASIGAYSNLAIELITVLFMILGALNFGLYYKAYTGHAREIWRDRELRLYMALLALGVGIASVAVMGTRFFTTAGEATLGTEGAAVRHSLFNIVSASTTTGFATADYNAWPFAATSVIVLLTLIGGCAGSTSGGLKVIRLWIVLKILLWQIERAFRPSVVRPLRVGTTVIDDEMKVGVLGYFIGAALLLVAGAFAVMWFEHSLGGGTDFLTAGTASLACFATTGPGLGGVGPAANFGWMTAPSKVVLSLMMLLGRLEIFAIVVLFFPGFWRDR